MSQQQKKVLNLITGNKNKLAEFQNIVPNDKFELHNIQIDLPELQGDCLDIAKEKVLLAYKQTGTATLTEDTSLCFNALKGLPGPYIKWFLDKLGHKGLNNMLVGFQDYSAYAQCIIGYMDTHLTQPLLFIGQTHGTIVQPQGPTNFGWDPIFLPDGYTQTYAEMDKEIKNSISHRGRAIQNMLKYFEDLDSKTDKVEKKVKTEEDK